MNCEAKDIYSKIARANYDRGNWSNDWDALELKKEELEIKKQNAENGGW